MIWPFKKKSAVATGDMVNESPLPRLPRSDGFRVVGKINDIPAEILFRHSGPGTHNWHDVSLVGISGEEEKAWIYIRGVAVRDRPGTRGGFIDFKEVLELRDVEANRSYRDWKDTARFLRLLSGGINEADAQELEAWRETRAAEVKEERWKKTVGAGSSRKFEPPINVKINTVDQAGNLATYDVALIGFIKFGTPFVMEAVAKPVGRRKPKTMRFTLPGYYKPDLEARSLTEKDTDLVTDIGNWLEARADRQRKERKKARS